MVLTLNLRHRGREAESECGCEEPSGEEDHTLRNPSHDFMALPL